jgi:hypothetical protein
MSRRLLWSLLLLIAALALAVVLIPALVIQPFRPQSPRGLEVSFFLKRLAPMFTIVALIVCLALVIRLWRGARWSRIALILLMSPAMLSAWFARQNHFEWMFNPLPDPIYAPATLVDFVDDRDMVVAVEIGGEAVAWPVRQMAYHHIVEDKVGGVPVVSTY